MGCFHEVAADGALEGKLGRVEDGFKEALQMAARKVWMEDHQRQATKAEVDGLPEASWYFSW